MHFLTVMLAYSLFTLSALHAIFMSFMERKLHHGSLNGYQTSLPSILSMESLLFRMIGIAFLLLTLTPQRTVFGTDFRQGLRPGSQDRLAFASWILFAALLFGRYSYGWRGRIALRWTLAGFLLLVLAYIGSRFVVVKCTGRT